jgi:hypothetical protein
MSRIEFASLLNIGRSTDFTSGPAIVLYNGAVKLAPASWPQSIAYRHLS